MQPGESRVAVEIWDLPVRLFHWILALLFVAQIVTGRIGGDLMPVHIFTGYSVLALIIFRVLWGFAGSTHSRFASFVAGPVATFRFALRLFSRQAVPQLGHNPLGGWSVLIMIGSFAVQAISGLFANDGVSHEGPLSPLVVLDVSNFMTEIHRWNVRVLIVVSLLHVVAVVFHILFKHEKIVRPMFTGVKEVPPELLRERREVVRGTRLRRMASRENSAAFQVSPIRALVLFILAAVIVLAVTQLPNFVEHAGDRNIPGMD